MEGCGLCREDYSINTHRTPSPVSDLWTMMVGLHISLCFGSPKKSCKGVTEYNSGGPKGAFPASIGFLWEVEGVGWAQTPSSVSLAEEGVRSEERGLGTQVWKI